MIRRSWLYSFIFSFLLFGSLLARTHTGKTFLLPQPMRLPTEQIFYDTCYSLAAREHNKNKLFGGNIQVTAFCRRDQNKKEVGQYFGRHEKNVISIGSEVTDFQSRNLIFTQNPTLKGELELRPCRKMRGVLFNYFHHLKDLSSKLFFSFSLPVIHVTRRMNARVCNEVKQTVGNKQYGILDYFSGMLWQPEKQAHLYYAKILPCRSQGRTDFGDIEASVSYQATGGSNPLNKGDRYYVRSSLGLVLPASNKPKGEYLFDMVTGNGKHWGFKVGAEAMAILYRDRKTKLSVTYSAALKYFLKNTQCRTLSFRSDDIDSRRSWAHYYGFLGEQGKRGVFPGANVLTRDVRVTPGTVFDFIVNYNLFRHNWLCSFGYNFFSRSEERVKPICWESGKYALASVNYDPTTPFVIAQTPNIISSDNIERAITREMLDTSVAQSPASISHKIYGMAGCQWDSIRIPVALGVGASYEFSQDNAALEGYELFLRVAASF